MNEVFKYLMNLLATYKALKEVQNVNKEQVRCKNITFFNILHLIQRNQGFQNFLSLYRNFKVLSKDEQRWILGDTFRKEDIFDIHEEELEILFEKTMLCKEVEKRYEKQDELKEIETSLSYDAFSKVLHSIRTGKIESQDIQKLTDSETLSFINHNSDCDIATLLSMSDENRLFYIREYQDVLRSIVDYDYSNIYRMRNENFQTMIRIIKERFLDNFCSCIYGPSYDMLEQLAKEYGNQDKAICDFVFYAFPNDESILEDGKLPDSFKKLIEIETKGKTEKELSFLKEKYFQFLNGNVFLLELRYQTILSDCYRECVNKEKVLELLDCNDKVEYQNRERLLVESGFFEADKISSKHYEFIKEIPKVEIMRERIHLILNPSFINDETQNSVINRMKNIPEIEDAKKINNIELEMSEEDLNRDQYQKLLEIVPGREEKIVGDGYTISLYNLSSFMKNENLEQMEFENNSLRLVIRKNNTCKKS